MSKTITFELEDEIYEVIKSMASSYNQPFEFIALNWLMSYSIPYEHSKENLSEENKLESYFGSISLGYPTGSNNEEIDRDLVKEYIGNVNWYVRFIMFNS